MTEQPPYRQNITNQLHPGLQLGIFLMVVIITLFAGSLISSAIITWQYGLKTWLEIQRLKVDSPGAEQALWIYQILSTTLPILIAPVFFAYVIVKQPADYLKVNIQFPPALLFVVLLIMFMSLPIIEVLADLNHRMVLPGFLKGLEEWMKASEKSAEKATGIILKMDTPLDLFKVMFLVAFMTAVVEEMMFRGALQTIFTRWTRNPHAAIWITAILFSAFHFEFYGFLPRAMLGVIFGYFVYWSGSIWTSIWAHFLNNGLAVVFTYLFQHKILKDNPDDQQVFNYSTYAFSVIITVLLLVNYRHIATREQQEIED